MFGIGFVCLLGGGQVLNIWASAQDPVIPTSTHLNLYCPSTKANITIERIPYSCGTGLQIFGFLQGHMLAIKGSQGMWNVPPDPEFHFQFFSLFWSSRTSEVLSGDH